MTEIRFSVSKEFHDNIMKLCTKIGCKKADYLRTLIINDFKNNIDKK